jgi:tRNA threonylcarbamoyladenosine biosynthesis protein TsaE
VPSPTFTLVQTYPTEAGELWHFDLYRLDRAEQIYELGLEEALAGGISLIEWPELIERLLPRGKVLTVALALGSDGARSAALSGGGAWADRLEKLRSTEPS